MAPKTVLITGCSKGGIGDAIAREFRSRGHVVFATARSAPKMQELVDMGIKTLELDVTSLPSIAAAVEVVRQTTGGRLDILINNAGMQHVLPFTDCDLADLKKVLDTNIFGVFAVTHAFLPLLIEARGVVASIGSVNQVFNPPYQVAYNASKAALTGFGETLRVELAPLGVRVVTIVTGSVRTRLFEFENTVPEGSLYYSLKERIEKRDFLDGVNWTPAEEYAKQVASDLLKDKPKPVVWIAATSTLARVINIFGWAGILDSAMLSRTGLNKLTRNAPSRPHQE